MPKESMSLGRGTGWSVNELMGVNLGMDTYSDGGYLMHSKNRLVPIRQQPQS